MNALASGAIGGVIFLLVMMISLIAHEAGHLVGGIVSGFQPVSIRLFQWTWCVGDRRWRRCRITQGQIIAHVLLDPPKDESKFKVTGYFLGGPVANLVVGGGASLLTLVWGPETIIGFIVIAFALLNFGSGIGNLIPLNWGVPNDAMNVYLARKSAAVRHGIYVMMRVNAHLMRGNRLRDLPGDLFVFEDGDDEKPTLYTAIVKLYEGVRYAEMGYPKLLGDILDEIDCSQLGKAEAAKIKSETLYHTLVYRHDDEMAQTLLTPEVKRYVTSETPSALRIRAACSFFLDHDHVQGFQCVTKARHLLLRLDNQGLVGGERDELDILVSHVNAVPSSPSSMDEEDTIKSE
ncbi:MAG: hypothetical protein LBM23_10585 [Propionibacteriaceae bacterium]|nr:hypothetical protein [Propionibacteriaceae bacterium]